MITLPTDLAPHQLRLIDEAIHKTLHPEQYDGKHFTILPFYHLPGAANDEVVRALMVHEKGYRDIYLAYERLLDGRDYLRADCGVWGGIASTLPRAILACAMDAWGIGIPEVQP